MTTETIESTPAQERKAKAAEQLQKLMAERETLQKRKQAAGPEVGRLHDEIAQAERAGAEAKTLSALRKERAEQEQVSGDLDRVLSNIEQELIPAQAELRAAEIACHADKYNEFVEKQRALAGVIDEAIHTIVETLNVKEGLARKQDAIHGEVGCPNPELSPRGVREALQNALPHQLKENAVLKNLPPFSRLDWSCRPMTSGGNLE